MQTTIVRSCKEEVTQRSRAGWEPIQVYKDKKAGELPANKIEIGCIKNDGIVSEVVVFESDAPLVVSSNWP